MRNLAWIHMQKEVVWSGKMSKNEHIKMMWSHSLRSLNVAVTACLFLRSGSFHNVVISAKLMQEFFSVS